jgi:hypothetical protein
MNLQINTFEECCERIINNELTSIIPYLHRIITVENYDKILELLEFNTSVTQLYFPHNILTNNSIDKLCRVLKNNVLTSVSISITNNKVNYTNFKLLTKAFGENTSLTHLYISENTFGSDELRLISEMLKVNKSITNISIFFRVQNMDNEAIIHMIEALKINKTLRIVTIPMKLDELFVCVYFARFLRDYNTLSEIDLVYGLYIDKFNINLIIDALESNRNIWILDGFNHEIDDIQLKRKNIYCDRNRHNINLRNLSILDIC